MNENNNKLQLGWVIGIPIFILSLFLLLPDEAGYIITTGVLAITVIGLIQEIRNKLRTRQTDRPKVEKDELPK